MVLGKYTFTGYEQDGRTGLQYANARWYDPNLGQFATHDPKRQFDSPYNYGAWDPTNLTDPSGEFIETVLAVAAIFAVAAGIDAGIQTGDPMEGFKAFGINMGIGILGGYVGSVVGPAISQVPATLRMAATLGLGQYGVVSSARNGAFVSAVATFGNMVYSAHGISQAQGGTSEKQVAGLESDATAPDITVEPGLADGDRGLKEVLSERLRETRINSLISEHSSAIEAAAAEFGADSDLIRGIIFEEQVHLLPGEAFAEQFGIGKILGIGQVTEGLNGFSREQLLDPAKNIRAIGKHLGNLAGQSLISPRSPLASIATRYSCGTCTSVTAYGRRVVYYRAQLINAR